MLSLSILPLRGSGHGRRAHGRSALSCHEPASREVGAGPVVGTDDIDAVDTARDADVTGHLGKSLPQATGQSGWDPGSGWGASVATAGRRNRRT